MKNFLFCLKCIAVTCMFFVFIACDGSSSSPNDDPLAEESSSSSNNAGSTTKMSSSEIRDIIGLSSSSDLNSACKNGHQSYPSNYITGTLTDSRDGQSYEIRKIGNHWWMEENLNFAYLHPTDSLDSSSFCVNDSLEYCDKYGRLYLWSAAMDSSGAFSTNGSGCGDDADCAAVYPVRGVCPEGWHIPEQREFATLFYAGIYSFPVEYSGLRVTAVETDYKFVLNFDGEVEHSVLVDDARAYIWSSEVSGNEAMTLVFHKTTYWNAPQYYDNTMKSWGASVRCVRDEDWMTDTVPLVAECGDDRSYREPCEYGSLTDSRDGQTYKTVKIGDQWWMAENLNYRYLQPTDCEDSSSFCYYDEDCSKYGRLYLWSAAMDSSAVFSKNGSGCGDFAECSVDYPVRGVCPEGWHLPSSIELEQLVSTKATWGAGLASSGLVMNSEPGTLLKGGSWKQGSGINAFGFTALPAGYRSRGEHYYDKGQRTCFWSSTSDVVHLANAVCFGEGDGVDLRGEEKKLSYSIRCLKDN